MVVPPALLHTSQPLCSPLPPLLSFLLQRPMLSFSLSLSPHRERSLMLLLPCPSLFHSSIHHQADLHTHPTPPSILGYDANVNFSPATPSTSLSPPGPPLSSPFLVPNPAPTSSSSPCVTFSPCSAALPNHDGRPQRSTYHGEGGLTYEGAEAALAVTGRRPWSRPQAKVKEKKGKKGGRKLKEEEGKEKRVAEERG